MTRSIELLFRYALPVILYLSLLIFLTLRSSNELPEWNIPYIDKIAHFSMFFGLSFLISRFLVSGLRRQTFWKIWLCAFALSALYATADEFLIQPMAEGRQMEAADFACNLAGSASGALFIPIYRRVRRWLLTKSLLSNQ